MRVTKRISMKSPVRISMSSSCIDLLRALPIAIPASLLLAAGCASTSQKPEQASTGDLDIAAFEAKSNREALESAQPANASADQVFRELQANEVDASSKYQGKKLSVSGTITSISVGGVSNNFAVVGVGEDISCHGVPREQVSGLIAGKSKVTVSGVISVISFNLPRYDLLLGPCELVSRDS